METLYDKQEIYQCISTFIEKFATEPLLKDFSLQSLDYKKDEFIFSKVTYHHLLIWNKELPMEDKIKLMASVELFVLSCDILDDLQDMDNEEPPWMKLASKYAMNLVFWFLSLSLALIEESSLAIKEKAFLYQAHSNAKIKAVNGQHQSLQRKMMSEEEQLLMIQYKSGSFMALACLYGSLSASDKQKELIERYGVLLGSSAQIENDLLGITEKQHYKDIWMKEITLPTIFLLKNGKTFSSVLSDYFEGKIKEEQVNPEIFPQYIEKSGAITYSRAFQTIVMKQAFSVIDQVYQNEQDRNQIKQIFLKEDQIFIKQPDNHK